MRAVTDHRHTGLGDCREDELAALTVGQGFIGFGVEDFGDDVVFVDVHTCLGGTLIRNTRTCDFGQTVDVVRVDVEQLLDLIAHFLGPRFRTEAAGLELEFLRIIAHFADRFAEEDRVGRRAAEHRRTEVVHHHQLSLRVARGHRNGHCTDAGRTLMGTKTACEEPIAVGDLNDIVLTAACRCQRTGDHFRPDLNVVCGIAGNDRLTGCAGGTLNTDDILFVSREETEGEFVAQVGLVGEGQLGNVGEGLDILGLDTECVHALTVQGNALVAELDGFLQAGQLQRLQFVSVHTFDFGIVDFVFRDFHDDSSSFFDFGK